MAWKEALIAALTERLAAAARSRCRRLAAWPASIQASDEYRRVTIHAPHSTTAGRRWSSRRRPRSVRTSCGPGYWVFTPARLADGSIVIVNRGFVPDGRARIRRSRPDGADDGPVEIVGAMRWPDARHWFTPNDDPAHNLWFARDPRPIAAAKGRKAPAAPFYVEQESPAPPGGLPQPGRLVVKPAKQPPAICRDLVRPGGWFWWGFSSAWAFDVRGAKAGQPGSRDERLGRPGLAFLVASPLLVTVAFDSRAGDRQASLRHYRRKINGLTVRRRRPGDQGCAWVASRFHQGRSPLARFRRSHARGARPRRRALCARYLAAARTGDDRRLCRPPLCRSRRRGDPAVSPTTAIGEADLARMAQRGLRHFPPSRGRAADASSASTRSRSSCFTGRRWPSRTWRCSFWRG